MKVEQLNETKKNRFFQLVSELRYAENKYIETQDDSFKREASEKLNEFVKKNNLEWNEVSEILRNEAI